MKVIFLDIDGVLALDDDTHLRMAINTDIIIPYKWNDDACKVLNQLLIDEDINIVLSSDWRKHYRLQEMRAILSYNNIEGNRLIGYTPIMKEYTRGQLAYGRSLEIIEWLKIHGVKKYVVIDDLNMKSTMIDPSHFVWCSDTKQGILVEGLIDRIKDKINGKS